MNSLLQDVRFAFRQMRRSPGFAATAVVILALGISANVIVFGVLQSLILRPLNVSRPERMMTFAATPAGYPECSYLEMRDIRDGNTVFSAVAGDAFTVFGLEVNGLTRPVWADMVSGQYFEAVAIKPYLGRLLERADDDHAGSEAAVLTWPAWKRDFAGDPGVVGRTVRVNKRPYTIVGVTPEGFNGTLKFIQPDLFVPMADAPLLEGGNWLTVRRDKHVQPIVRLKDGVTVPQAQAELSALAARLAAANPKEEAGLAFWLAPAGLVGNFLGGPAKRFLAGVMLLAGIVLLAACANLGGLFAARTAERTREIAIRLAVGSSRGRVVRQVMVEAMLVSILGGVCACGLSWLALQGLAQWHPPSDYPIRFLVEPQPSLVLIALLISLAAGIVFGLMPLRQIFKADPNDAIKGGGEAAPGRGWARRWALRDVLLAAQIALCCVTVTAAFVSLRGMQRSVTMDLGFNPKNAVLTKFEIAPASPQEAEQFQQKLLHAAADLPGVTAAAYTNTTPLGETTGTNIFTEQTTDFRPPNRAFAAYFYLVSPGYFAAAETPLLEGRDIQPTDTAKTPAVAVVNQFFAQHLFKTSHAVGRTFKNNAGVSIQIVGIVPDGKYFMPSEEPSEAAFFPILQRPSTTTTLVVRTRPDASGAAAREMAERVRKLVHDLDPAIPIRLSEDWRSTLALNFFPVQVATVTLGLFGAFGLLLSVTGTFGLASYTVSKRLRELSIRVALGAQGRQVLTAALGRMLVLIGGGSAVGLLLGLATSRVLSAIVYQASARDPFVLAAVAATILLTGLLSVAGPVHRALRVNPAHLLREQ